uniref:ABC-type xenobiotic transporter n=1 Tax=Aceria tosichella TaxID=561515 RepID=A0A6G1SFW3_9ACAR
MAAPQQMASPVPFLQLFRYASREDLILLFTANIFILYSSFNIPLVNIVYGLMMREMNDYVARRALFTGSSGVTGGAYTLLSPVAETNYTTSSAGLVFNQTTTTETSTTTPAPFNGTFHDAQEIFINNSYNLCMIVILFGLTRFVALYLALLFFSRAASNQAKRVKALFFRSLLRQEVAWFERNRTGDFAIRITSDLSKFEDGIGEKIALCLNALFAWMSSLISSFYYGWELTLVCLVLVPLTIFITTVIAEFQASYSIRENAALSRAFNVCHEVISSIRTVLSYSGQQKEADRFKRGLDSAYKYGLKRNMFAGLNLGFTWMSGYLGFAICLLYSTKFYKPEYFGHYDEAHIITILWSAAGCVFLLNRMMPFIEIIQIARGSASNLFAVIERKSQIDATSEEGMRPAFFEANVVFDSVGFSYPSNGCGQTPTIKNMSMEVKSGQTIALVGPSGSGKSTALALLQRYYEIDEGTITLGGYNLRELNLGWLRGQFGVVTQEPVLFDMSIADNIRLGARPGQPVSDYDVEQAARSANAHAFIVRLPNGYETRAGARGVQLSGGQKQRIAIARALVRQPKILLLDEATSALDLESESIVQEALDQARIGRTTFIVAHRLSTVRNADKIIVFDKGTIVEGGTHEELIQKRGLYYQIHAQQKQGIDLFVPQGNRRNSMGTSLGGCGGGGPAGGHPTPTVCGGGAPVGQGATAGAPGATAQASLGDQYTRQSRSLSIYSTTGKYATATGGFGAAGHGGNGEGVDNGGGSCCAAVDGKFTDDDYYNRNGDDNDDDDEEEETEESDTSRGDKALLDGKPSHTKIIIGNEETQASLLDGESFNLINNKTGKKVSHLSLMMMLRFIKPDFTYSTIGIIASLLMGLCIPMSAMIIGDIATIFATDDKAEIRQGLFTHGLMYTVLAIFALIVSFIQVLSFGLAGEKIGINLRLRGFQAIMDHELAWFDQKRNNPGSICARLASDVGNVQSITGNRTAVIFQSISILVSTFIFAIYFNLKFSSICAMFVAILLISTVMQARYAGKLAQANRAFDSQIGKIVLESSANIKTLVSLHQESYFIDRCEQLLQRDTRSRSLDNHLRLSLESLKYAMTAISKGASFYFAAGMLLNDEISIDVIFKLIEIILYGLTEASKSLIFISDLEKARRGTQNLYKLIYSKHNHQHGQQDSQLGGGGNQKSITGKLHSAAYLQAPPSLLPPKITIEEGTGDDGGDEYPPTGKRCSGNLRFDSVKFNYPSRPDACVLRALSVDIPAGKTIALVGRSGCGKSTTVQLMEKFYHYSQGSIQLDGHDLKRLPTEWVRRQIALVSQEPTLLSYTIGDNIRYGDNSREVSLDEVIQAARVANIHDFIMSLPNGYDTSLSESNSLQLSGGQKQRIAIARALVRKAPILVFDEATSALDTKSEHIVQEALDRARAGKTCIIIAHRLSAIKNADLIVVLRNGQVVEKGAHRELLEKRGEYYCLYKTQSKM